MPLCNGNMINSGKHYRTMPMRRESGFLEIYLFTVLWIAQMFGEIERCSTFTLKEIKWLKKRGIPALLREYRPMPFRRPDSCGEILSMTGTSRKRTATAGGVSEWNTASAAMTY